MIDKTKEVAETQGQKVAREAGNQSVRQPSEPVIVPAVDVYEDESGITLTADLPGVSHEQLMLQVDQNTLVIEGEAKLDTPTGIQALYAEVRNPHYRRDFALSNELDSEAVEANLKDGVLTVRLPKKAPYQPRKIPVQTV